MYILTDGRMAFTEYEYKRLVTRKADGSSDFEIQMKESIVLDSTIVHILIVAVSFGWNNYNHKACIKMIDIDSGETTYTIDKKSRVYGIVCVDDNLGLSPNGIYKIDNNTNVESVISKAIYLCR